MSYIKNKVFVAILVGLLGPAPALAQERDCNVSVDPLPYLSKITRKKPHNIVQRASTTTKAPRIALNALKTLPITDIYPAQVVRTQGLTYIVAQKGQRINKPEAVTEGTILNLGDELQTSEQSFVSLRLGDGTISTIPSNSRVELARSKLKVARFILHSGTIENRVQKKPSAKQNTFEIQIPNAIVGVRGTQFRVHHSQANSSVEVGQGTVWVQPRQTCVAPLVLNEGQGARVENLNQAKPGTLLAAPVLKSKDEAQKSQTMDFAFDPVPGAVKYHAMVAVDEDFIDVQTESFSETPQFHIDDKSVSNGFYYVRLTAIDAIGVEGAPGIHLFMRAKK